MLSISSRCLNFDTPPKKKKNPTKNNCFCLVVNISVCFLLRFRTYTFPRPLYPLCMSVCLSSLKLSLCISLIPCFSIYLSIFIYLPISIAISLHIYLSISAPRKFSEFYFFFVVLLLFSLWSVVYESLMSNFNFFFITNYFAKYP